jgi:hypothetical protein
VFLKANLGYGDRASLGLYGPLGAAISVLSSPPPAFSSCFPAPRAALIGQGEASCRFAGSRSIANLRKDDGNRRAIVSIESVDCGIITKRMMKHDARGHGNLRIVWGVRAFIAPPWLCRFECDGKNEKRRSRGFWPFFMGIK